MFYFHAGCLISLGLPQSRGSFMCPGCSAAIRRGCQHGLRWDRFFNPAVCPIKMYDHEMWYNVRLSRGLVSLRVFVRLLCECVNVLTWSVSPLFCHLCTQLPWPWCHSVCFAVDDWWKIPTVTSLWPDVQHGWYFNPWWRFQFFFCVWDYPLVTRQLWH